MIICIQSRQVGKDEFYIESCEQWEKGKPFNTLEPMFNCPNQCTAEKVLSNMVTNLMTKKDDKGEDRYKVLSWGKTGAAIEILQQVEYKPV